MINLQTHMLINTMSEIAKANRALCFSNVVSSWNEEVEINKHESMMQ